MSYTETEKTVDAVDWRWPPSTACIEGLDAGTLHHRVPLGDSHRRSRPMVSSPMLVDLMFYGWVQTMSMDSASVSGLSMYTVRHTIETAFPPPATSPWS
jgi:hypothetical protein